LVRRRGKQPAAQEESGPDQEALEAPRLADLEGRLPQSTNWEGLLAFTPHYDNHQTSAIFMPR
jgi:hypothetical protein